MILRCFGLCTGECKKIYYISQPVESVWPSDSVLQSFYEQTIIGKPYEEKFSRYFTNIHPNSNSPNNTGDPHLHLNLERKRIVQSNFAKVVMYLSEWEYILYKDTPKYTFYSMVGNVGGALNLWAGITVVVAVEILELFLRMLIYDWSEQGLKTKQKDIPRNGEPQQTIEATLH